MITQKMILHIVPNLEEEYKIKRAKRYKILYQYFDFHGFEFDYPLCCVMWFCYENTSIRVKVPEYNTTMGRISNRILCPDCLIKKIKGGN